MKLNQKLKSFAMDNHIEKYAEHNAKELERIADDYAIEFAEWCVDNELFYSMKYGRIKTKELLEMFKKEKAEELFKKYLIYFPEFYNVREFDYDEEKAKRCALIAIDLLIYHTEEDSSNIPLYEYYLKVKQEIEKL